MTERRETGDRRRHGRRSADREVSPLSTAALERIAHTLDSIRDVLAGRRHELYAPPPRQGDRDTPGAG